MTTNPQNTACPQLIREALTGVRDAMRDQILASIQAYLAKLEADLIAKNWDIEAVHPYPNGNMSRAQYRQAEAIYKRSRTWLKSRLTCGYRRHHDPDFVDFEQEPVARFARALAQADKLADEAFEGYVMKLAVKVTEDAPEVVGVEYRGGGNPWDWSHLTVKHADGSQAVWRTKQIVNVSCLGKLFNQWPTNKLASKKMEVA